MIRYFRAKTGIDRYVCYHENNGTQYLIQYNSQSNYQINSLTKYNDEKNQKEEEKNDFINYKEIKEILATPKNNDFINFEKSNSFD